ncbi:MAG: NfeD family protein [Gordonia sp. (in: high G+C Gram-positive bacteria)]|uniref:NfeD family protein n=1 Tax=Gordonia sp. (in: high G+C Gram-positive bacteria) TaxID=84139 RepID=UPI0039E6B37D
MTALAWLIAAVLLVAAELLVGELVLLMLGGGAAAAALVAFVWHPAGWIPAVVFAVVALLLLLTVRPVARRHLRERPAVPTNAEALLGQKAVVLAPVDGYKGRVKIGGDVWSARSGNPHENFGQGETLVVLQIDGATAIVGKEA